MKRDETPLITPPGQAAEAKSIGEKLVRLLSAAELKDLDF